jgi:hypothetical protein
VSFVVFVRAPKARPFRNVVSSYRRPVVNAAEGRTRRRRA